MLSVFYANKTVIVLNFFDSGESLIYRTIKFHCF